MKTIQLSLLLIMALCGPTHAQEKSGTAKVAINDLVAGNDMPANKRNGAVDHHLQKLDVVLPNDYLLIASQPKGVVSNAVLFDLNKRKVRILPGTHSRNKETEKTLTEDNHEFLVELLRSPVVKNLPAESGNFGMDGGSAVVYYKLKEHEKFMSHWSPDHAAMYMFLGLMEQYR